MHKPKLKHLLLAVSLSLGTHAAYAASLGALTVLSSIGQPLNAEVELTNASEQELASLTAKVATPGALDAQSFAQSKELASLHVEVGARPDGQPVLWLSSTEPISSPSLDMMIELDWGAGSLARKVIVALEPAPAEEAQEDVALPDLTAPIPEERSEQVSGASSTEASSPSDALPGSSSALNQFSASSAAAPIADYAVEKGDTLRNIAVQHGVDGVSLEQMMVGLHSANPQAFIKNDMNRLKTGAILRTPSAEELKAIEQKQAAQTVRMHTKNWSGYRDHLAEAVAKAAPAKEESAPSTAVSGKIDSVKDQAAASGARDVVKLSGGATETGGKANQGKQDQAALEEELVAREKALQESNERIALLEKQLQDAKKLLELRKAETAQSATAQPASTGIATQQTQLQQQLSWGPAGAAIAAIFAALALLWRNKRKGKTADVTPDTPVAMPVVADEETFQPEPVPVETASEAMLEPVAAFVAESAYEAYAEPASVLDMGDIAALMPEPVVEPVEVVSAPDAVLDMDDITALMPELAPEPAMAVPVVDTLADIDSFFAEPAQPDVAPEEPAAQVSDIVVEPEIKGTLEEGEASLADLMEMPAEPPTTVEEDQPATTVAVGEFDFDDAFSDEAALADLVASTPEVAEPVDAVAEAMVDEAATDIMALENHVVAEDSFDLDDVFSGAVPESAPAEELVAELVPEIEPETPEAVAEAAFDVDDVFAAKAVPTEAEIPVSTQEISADEADLAAAMAAAIQPEAAFDLDDVFAEAAEAAEPVTDLAPVEELVPEVEPAIESTEKIIEEAKPEPAKDDHSAALSAAFDESATADLNDLDFGFDIDLGDLTANTAAITTKAPAKKATAEKLPALDFSNINLNVAGTGAASAAEINVESPEVDTKLDLVTAYIDMNDDDGARELLQEVLKEGGENQKARAQKLLDSLK